jgi:hypothetical protein
VTPGTATEEVGAYARLRFPEGGIDMQPSALAKYRIDDLIREAEAERATRRVRAVQAAERRAKFRRITTAAVTMLLWPARH